MVISVHVPERKHIKMSNLCFTVAEVTSKRKVRRCGEFQLVTVLVELVILVTIQLVSFNLAKGPLADGHAQKLANQTTK